MTDAQSHRDSFQAVSPTTFDSGGAVSRQFNLNAEDYKTTATIARSGPAAILVGWGMQRRRHGAAIVRALDALAATSGNLFRSGGGFLVPNAVLLKGKRPVIVQQMISPD